MYDADHTYGQKITPFGEKSLPNPELEAVLTSQVKVDCTLQYKSL